MFQAYCYNRYIYIVQLSKQVCNFKRFSHTYKSHLFEEGSFVPCGKFIDNRHYSIIADYLGTPTHCYDETGKPIWERELDIYGTVRKEIGEKGFVPQLYQGQYVDEETGLAYNRFRYYDSDAGNYISQDPIGLMGGIRFYGYVHDTNLWIDEFGLTRGKRVEKLPKNLRRRPKWKQSTRNHLNENNPKTADGKFIDVKTGKPIEPGNEVIGHQDQSWRGYQEDPANANKTRDQVIKDYNNVDNLGYEDKTSSSSDGGKYRGHEH